MSIPVCDRRLFAIAPGNDQHFVGRPVLIGHLSPEDNSAVEVYRLTPSLS